MKKTLMIMSVAALICSGCDNSVPSRNDDALALLESLREASLSAPLLGHQDDLMYGHDWRLEKDATDWSRSDIKAVSGKYPVVYGLDIAGLELGDECNLDGNDFEQMRLSALAHCERGGILTISWHCFNPLTGGNAWDVSSDKVVGSILEGGEKHGLFMEWLDRVADYLESFRTADGKLPAIIFRPWHEHTGSWFWWGQDLCTTEQYTALWKMCYDYLNGERGLTNLVWAYSPSGKVECSYMERYPGDEIVDIVGADIYQYGNVQDYQNNLSIILSRAAEAAREHGKILALTETGLEGLGESDWWSNALLPVLEQYPISYVLVWRNAYQAEKHYFVPFPGQDSEADFLKVTADGKIKLL